jgi:hypothetical protein
MAKILKAEFPNKCIGCELCVYEMQRQLERVGLEGALIRVLKTRKLQDKLLEFSIEIDPRAHSLLIERIKNICPKGVFTLVDEETYGFDK